MGPSHIQCSTFTSLASTLALKLFRGEPAISGFDWNFTPSHSSSANVSTGVGSVPFQRGSVRSSIGSYPDFNLIMARSPGFGSMTCNFRPLKTRFRFGSASPA